MQGEGWDGFAAQPGGWPGTGGPRRRWAAARRAARHHAHVTRAARSLLGSLISVCCYVTRCALLALTLMLLHWHACARHLAARLLAAALLAGEDEPLLLDTNAAMAWQET